jgi:glycosyltransferase involved in cell wall biosynthesis
MSIATPYLSPSLTSSLFVFPREQTAKLPEVSSLHLINGEHFSGAERVQQLLGRRLSDFGVSSHFACLKPGKFPELSGLESDRVASIGMKSRFDLSIVRRIAEYADEIHADVLHAHTPRTAMIASFAAKRCMLPWVYHVHSPTARDSTRKIINQLNGWVEAYSLRNADHIITVSKSLRREMLRFGHSRHKVTAVANGVAEQPPIDPLSRLDQQTWKLGMVALVRPRKGIEVLLEAMAKIRNDRNRITLEVIGGFETPEYESHIRRLIDQLKLQETVQLRGFTKDVPSVMRTFDAMVLPSLFGEGMPMVVLEALACGVPVIATRVEGTPEVIRHGREGLLARPQDPASLADAIQAYVSDRKAWCRMSELAVQRHRDGFSDVQMAQKTASVYRKLLNRVRAR